MPVCDASRRSFGYLRGPWHVSLRLALLAGVSAAAIVAAGAPAYALDLRQLGSSSAATAAAVAASQAGSAQAAAVAQQSQKTLAAAMQAIQAMQQVQANARAAAFAGSGVVTTNGLGVGGLNPDSGVPTGGTVPASWVNIGSLSQSTNSSGQTIVTIGQSGQYAQLNWTTFNVSRNTIVDFLQGGSNWAALNFIGSGSPSIIEGQINAPGAVYLINQNGIFFNGTSQVNVGTLIASSLNITNLTSFLNGNGILGSGVGSSSTVTSFQSFANGQATGGVTVQAGAQINAPSGDVLLLAPTVENDGAISTPLGQTLLVGGSDVILTAGTAYVRGFEVGLNINAGVPNAPGLYYSSTTPGIVTNDGSIAAPQGNITIVAGSVNQNGVLTSTTSTTFNGSINIQAQGGYSTGTLTLGGVNDNPLYGLYGVAAQPSLIQIIPDPTDQSLVTDTQAIANSSISLQGVNVDIRGIVQLQGYDVTNPNDQPGGITIIAAGTTNSSGVLQPGTVFLEDGSLLDGSGTTDAVASASRNSVAVQLLSNELADSPVVHGGPLYQQTIYVDASVSGTYADGTTWQGTPVANASAWIALTTRSLEERMMNGAPITIGGLFDPTEDVTPPVNLVQLPGSSISVSGGYLTYTPGFVQVSTLITSTGQLVSASSAQANVDYAGVCCSFTVTHPAWGAAVTQTYSSPLMSSGYFSPGYTQGGAGGSLTLNVAAAVLDGTVYSSVVAGEKQLTLSTAPSGATLTINSPSTTESQNLNINIVQTAYSVDNIFLSDSGASTAAGWLSGFNVATSNLNTVLQTNQPSSVASSNSVYLPTSSWLNSGFASVSLGANTEVSLAAGNNIILPAGGSFSAKADTVDIESSITAPGGTISLPGAFTVSSTAALNANDTVSPTSGLLTIGSGITLSVAGLWTNDIGTGPIGPIAPNGGAITLGSYGDINVGAGSVLNVSGGGHEISAGKITAGNGGTLAISAGISGTATALPTPAVSRGYVNFIGGLQAGQLQGYGTIGSSSVGNGGTLNLTTIAVPQSNGTSDPIVATIAPTTGGALLSQSGPTQEMGGAGDNVVSLAVSTDFFSSGGFANVSLTAAGISLPQFVTLAPTVASLSITNRAAPSATSLARLATPVTLAPGVRPLSSTTLHATGELWNAEVVNGGGSLTSVDTNFGLNIAGTIQTDPLGTVNLIGDQIAIVSGTVIAPGGTISLSGGTYNNSSAATPLVGEGVWLTGVNTTTLAGTLTGAGTLSAAGTVIDIPQSNGTTYQDVLPGGQVNVSGGDIVLAFGSTIDVSGASGLSSLSAAGSGFSSGLSLVNLGQSLYPAASAGGTISVSAILGAALEGKLLGNSGGPGAASGTLIISMAAHGNGATAEGELAPGGYWPNIETTTITLQPTVGDSTAGPNPLTVGGDLISLDANIPLSTATITQGGFSSLTLTTPSVVTNQGNVEVTFSPTADVSLTLANQLTINVATIVVPNGRTETLTANYVLWQNSGVSGLQANPYAGLVVNALSTTSTISIGSVGVTDTFTTATGLALVAGQTIALTDKNNAADYLVGTVTSYDAAKGTLTVSVTSDAASDTPSSWTVSAGGKIIGASATNSLTILGGPSASSFIGTEQSFGITPGLTIASGETITLSDSTNSGNYLVGKVFSYDPSSGSLIVTVTAAAITPKAWDIATVSGNVPATGTLAINARNVDLVGNLAVQSAMTTTFNVSGDLRLDGNVAAQPTGSLESAGDLDFSAGQIYPSTDTTFTLASPTAISFSTNGSAPTTPFSAGGVLNVYAPDIEQGGTLRAPTGTINLGYTGQTDTGTLGSNPVLPNGTVAGVPAGGPGAWDFTTSGEATFVPGSSVTITNGGVTVTGLVESFAPATGGTSASLVVEGTAVTGLGATPPSGNWTISTIGANFASTGSNVTLKSGSLTSVSADGLIVPFGYTTNGTVWSYNPDPADVLGAATITAPPAKVINLAGTNVVVQSNATIDESGGGDLYAGEFVPGTGGSLNIFTGANHSFAQGSNVYAVIPGYTGPALYDPGINTSGPSLGQQVYLTGVPGLAAGVYTLLPSQYAELPGAFLVTAQIAPGASTVAATRAPIQSTMLPDGSYVASGYVVTPGTGTTAEHWSVFTVMSDTVARKYTQINDSFANTFFTTLAETAGTAIPRLPQDAGQLSITVTNSLSFQGTGDFAHPNGLGGVADISANQILVVDTTTADNPGLLAAAVANDQPVGDNDPWDPIVLGAGQLNNLGVESLLLGGTRSFQSDGVHITTSASAVVIANDVNDPLVLPDVQLIAAPELVSNTITGSTTSGATATISLLSAEAGTGQVVIAPGAVINASGAVSPGDPTNYFLSGPQSAYSAATLQAYYKSVAQNQIAYVRVSGGGLVTTAGGTANYTGVPPNNVITDKVVSAQSITAFGNMTIVDASGSAFQLDQPITLTDPTNPANQIVGYVFSVSGTSVTIHVNSQTGSGSPVNWTMSGAAGTELGTGWFQLPTYTPAGSISIGAGAQLSASNSLTLFGSGTTTIAPNVTIIAQAAELKSNLITLGQSSAGGGLLLNQATLTDLANVNALTLVSAGEIDVNGDVTLGQSNADGQPNLSSLVLDSAGLVETGSGTAIFTAEQVTFQNTLGGSISPTTQLGHGSLSIVAFDRGIAPDGSATVNNASISLGTGAVTLVGFDGDVTLKSSGQILVTGDGGSLNVRSALTLDAPRISGGTLSFVNGLPQFGAAAYTITAANSSTTPTYYSVTLQNSSGTAPILPTALLGNSLTIVGGQINIDTPIVMPGGAFNATANGVGGNINVGSSGIIDVSGQATSFLDVVASIGGGNINLASTSGAIVVNPGALLNVSDIADIGALNQNSAGTLSLSAPTGGVSIAEGTLAGAGPTVATSGSFVLDTNSLDQLSTGSLMTYQQLASMLAAGGFGNSWNIRARSGSIQMTGVSQVHSLTVSTDTGDIDVSGTINASATVNEIGISATSGIQIGSIGLQETFSTGTGLAIATGQSLTLSDRNNSANYFVGTVNSYNSATGALVVTVTAEGGSGVPTDWLINGAGTSTTSATDTIRIGSIGTTQTFTTTKGLGYTLGQEFDFGDEHNTGNYFAGTVTAYNPTTGALSVLVTGEGGSGAPLGWTITTPTTPATTGGTISLYAGNDLTLESTAYLNAHGSVANASGTGGQVWLAASQAGNQQGTLYLNVGATIDVGADSPASGVSGPVLGGTVTFSTSRNAANSGVMLEVNNGTGTFAEFLAGESGSPLTGVHGESAWDGVVVVGNQVYTYTPDSGASSSINLAPQNASAANEVSLTIQPGLNFFNSQPVTLVDSTDSANSIIGSIVSYNAATGAIVVSVASSTLASSAWSVVSGTIKTTSSSSITFAGLSQSPSLSLVVSASLGLKAGQSITLTDNTDKANTITGTVSSYNATSGALTIIVNTVTSPASADPWGVTHGSSSQDASTYYLTPTAFNTLYLNDPTTGAAGFMNNQSAIWSALGADSGIGTVSATGILNGATVGQVLVNIRPGITIKNSGGNITVQGDLTNPVGIDLSGSAYNGSPLNTSDAATLDGHFGQYDEPIVLAIRAAGNLNFGTYNAATVTLTLGSLSDGFSENTGGLTGTITGAGASGAAALFDPAATGYYNSLSGGLGADSATFLLTAGADTTAANPLAVKLGNAGTLTVAGVPGGNPTSVNITNITNVTTGQIAANLADPLYLYNYDTNNGVANVSIANFVNFASLVRTGTGNIDISTTQDLVLQSPQSLVYTAGTGYNVNGTSAQPLSGFTQYNGNLTINGVPSATLVKNDSLPASVFPTHGGDVTLTVGGNIDGAMNAGDTIPTSTTVLNAVGQDQELPYDMTALGSQLKLQNWYTGAAASLANSNLGSFSDLYATDAWISSSGISTHTIYTVERPSASNLSLLKTTGDYQLAWYTWFPFLENTIGSFGGGNISVKAGGSISNVQFVSPTNARDAGPALIGTSYNASLQTGLYVQGGGNVLVTAGGNIEDVYTYVQNGSTTLQAGGSIGCLSACATATPVTTPIAIETSTGEVSVFANRSIDIADQTVEPSITTRSSLDKAVTLSGLSLIQNASFLIDIAPAAATTTDATWAREITVMNGILTAVPAGTVTLSAVGNVVFSVGVPGPNAWNTSQGILPAQLNLISLEGSVTNNGDIANGNASFVTYPTPTGTVNLLAQGSVTLNAGFVISDANPNVMPTLANIANVLAPYDQTVSSANETTMTLTSAFPRIKPNFSSMLLGGAAYVAGQDPAYSVILGDSFAQLISDNDNSLVNNLIAGATPSTTTEAERHANLHVGDDNPARIYALGGDVADIFESSVGITPNVNVPKAIDIFASRDVVNLALLGQNNNANDVTSIIAGRDVIYTNAPPPFSNFGLAGAQLLAEQADQWVQAAPYGIAIGGPGNLFIESGRNVDLGISQGIRTIGNLLNPSMPSTGAGITIEVGVGSGTIDYAAFVTQFIDTATAGQYAEPLQLFNVPANGITDALTYFESLSPTNSLPSTNNPPTFNQAILLNRIFFGLLRDSGREHTDTTGDTNYEVGTDTIDTAAQFNSAYSNYQRAFAAIAAYLPTSISTTATGGSFLGGLSTVRTLNGGSITILAPNGQIQVGQIAVPASFPGYSLPDDPTWALGFGIVTERGGDIDLYAQGDIAVNQSRVFTLEGGDMTIMSLDGNIDAGKGAKTVETIQPPTVSFDRYGNITITPFGPSSGSGIATVHSLPNVPAGNVDLLAPNGYVNPSDAGIRSSGNISIASPLVLNAFNIQAAGKVTGIPVVAPPDIGAITTAGNVAGAAVKATEAPNDSGGKNDHPSVIIVEVLGYGGGEPCDGPAPPASCKRNEQQNLNYDPNALQFHSYNTNSVLQLVGNGVLTGAQQQALTEEERQNLSAR